MKDIENREDVKLLIHKFYKKVVLDPKIGHFFMHVIKLDWDIHIPIMVDFWDSILLGGASYKGNPMAKHIDLHKKEKLTPKHFDRWLSLWEQTIVENFKGPKADEAISRANSIGNLMQFKINQTGEGSSTN